jgi:hypothetical protein
VRRGLAEFDSPEIRSRASEAIRHIVQNHAAIYRSGAGLEAEIEILSPVQPLNCLQILRIQLGNLHEDAVIHGDAVLILMGGTLYSASVANCRISSEVFPRPSRINPV